MGGSGFCQFQAWLLKISCAICRSILSLKLADWMGEVVDSKKTLGDSGSTWWKRSAQEYVIQVEQFYSIKVII